MICRRRQPAYFCQVPAEDPLPIGAGLDGAASSSSNNAEQNSTFVVST